MAKQAAPKAAKMTKASGAPKAARHKDGSLTPFANDAVRAELDTLETLLSQSRRLVLLGAGCSRAAGLPLTAELYKLVLSRLSNDPAKTLLAAIETEYDDATHATIEDFLSDIVDLKAMADRREHRGCSKAEVSYQGTAYSSEQLDDALRDIKAAIRDSIAGNKPPMLSTHRAFVRHLHSLLAGKTVASRRTDYFIMNYDTLIEDALAMEHIPFTDGLAGGAMGWWEPVRFADPAVEARVIKLHGSIDWCLFEHNFFPSRLRPTAVATPSVEQVMIWPTSTKYRETQLDPFAQVLDIFRGALRPTRTDDAVILVIGYSFGDAHINLEIERGLRDSGERLSMLAMCYEDGPPAALESWLRDAAIGSQVRAYCAKEFWNGGDRTLLKESVPWGDFAVLTRLLGGER